jgi:DNA-binding MarR family transcriptional regulator
MASRERRVTKAYLRYGFWRNDYGQCMPGRSEDLQAMEEALLLFLNAYRRSRARLHRDPDLHGLTWAQFMVLQAASRYGSQGISRIAAEAELAQPPATRALQRLETMGLLARGANPDDRRLTVVEITESGRQLLRHHRKRLRKAARRLHDSVEADRRREAAELLSRLGEALEDLP